MTEAIASKMGEGKRAGLSREDLSECQYNWSCGMGRRRQKRGRLNHAAATTRKSKRTPFLVACYEFGDRGLHQGVQFREKIEIKIPRGSKARGSKACARREATIT